MKNTWKNSFVAETEFVLVPTKILYKLISYQILWSKTLAH